MFKKKSTKPAVEPELQAVDPDHFSDFEVDAGTETTVVERVIKWIMLVAVMAMAAFLVNVQDTLTRRIGPMEPTVFTVGCVQSGNAFNIVSERSVLKGSLRSFKPEVRERALEIIRDDQIDGVIVDGSQLLVVNHSADEESLSLEIEKKEKYKSISQIDEAKMILRIPAHLEFEELDIYLNSSSLEAERLDAKELRVNINASAAEIREVNAGVLEVENNAGSLWAYGTIGEKMEVDCNAGTTEMQINGSYDEFNYEVDCSVGAIRLGNKDYSGLKSTVSLKNEGAKKTMDLNCGVGNIDIQLDEE